MCVHVYACAYGCAKGYSEELGNGGGNKGHGIMMIRNLSKTHSGGFLYVCICRFGQSIIELIFPCKSFHSSLRIVGELCGMLSIFQ